MCANKFIIDHYKMTKISVSSCCIMVVKLIYIKFETVQSMNQKRDHKKYKVYNRFPTF